MAHKKAGGSTKNGRDSNPQYRGVKAFGGQHVHAGSIIVTQVGSVFHAGKNVGTASNFTLYAMKNGVVSFAKKAKGRQFVSIIPDAQEA